MSGHSKWSTIKRQKGATDAKRGNLFTKIANAITIAVREGGGGDPESNFRLRLVIEKAREANMPKENIQRSVDRGLGKGGGAQLESAIFEGFGPSGTAVMVEAVTDNKNRTGGEIRNYFDKKGGNLGGTGSVGYMFTRVGEIEVKKNDLTLEKVLEKVMELNVLDIEEGEDSFILYSHPEELHRIKGELEAAGLSINSAQLAFKANESTMVQIDEDEKKTSIVDFLEGIEDMDDVQNVFVNAKL